MGGDVHVDEIERTLERDLPRGDYETIAGLVIAQFGGLPEPGASIEVELEPDPADLAQEGERAPTVIRIDVLKVERHVPALVRLSLIEDRDETQEVAP